MEAALLGLYWKSCEQWTLLPPSDAEKEIIAGVLELPLPGSTKSDKFVVRKVYDFLWEKILEKEAFARVGHPKAIIVTGTPGIGKSVMIYYFVYKLLHDPSFQVDLKIVFHNNRGTYLLQRGRPSTTFRSIDDCDELLLDPNTWYLVDGVPPYPCICWMLLTTSPRRDVYKSAQKRLIPLYYMPPFSEAEMTLACHYCSPELTFDLVQERFKRWGGVPRYVLSPDNGNEIIELEAALLMAQQGDLYKQLLTVNNSGHDTLVHRLFHLIPDETFRRATVEPASDYVADKLYNLLQDSVTSDINAFIIQCASMPTVATFRTYLLERQFHVKIPQGGTTVRVRPLTARGREETWTIPALKHTWVNGSLMAEVGKLPRNAKNMYLQPTSKSHRSLDSVMICDVGQGTEVILLQITVNVDHPVYTMDISDAYVNAERRSFACKRLVFVVPPELFPGYKRQNYRNQNGTISQRGLPSDVPVTQYVMEFPPRSSVASSSTSVASSSSS